jgi:hypothetical protein
MSEDSANPKPPNPNSDYWREFWRVNFDKIILVFLILFMVALGADERLTYACLGALASAITHNRWQRNP